MRISGCQHPSKSDTNPNNGEKDSFARIAWRRTSSSRRSFLRALVIRRIVLNGYHPVDPPPAFVANIFDSSSVIMNFFKEGHRSRIPLRNNYSSMLKSGG